jgi:hypothetical protein
VRVLRLLLAALDLVSVAGALEGIAPGSARGLTLAVVAVLGLVLVAVAIMFLVALRDQLRPPYGN